MMMMMATMITTVMMIVAVVVVGYDCYCQSIAQAMDQRQRHRPI